MIGITVGVANTSEKTLKTIIHPDFLMKFDFEIAIDQQTRACDQTFEGVALPTGARGTATPIFGPNYAQLTQIIF